MAPGRRGVTISSVREAYWVSRRYAASRLSI